MIDTGSSSSSGSGRGEIASASANLKGKQQLKQAVITEKKKNRKLVTLLVWMICSEKRHASLSYIGYRSQM
jgi:hypothetical protein